jgi:ribosomal protein S20
MRKAVKAARQAIESGGADKAALVADAIREVQKAGTKKVVGANTVSRYVSRLARAANR